MIGILLSAEVKATENVDKVRAALLNICPIAQIELIHDTSGATILQGKATEPEAIAHLARKFRDARILEAVRQALLNCIENGTLIFGMHRQAAFVGRLHLCDLDDVSAMGPIRVEISAKNILDVIDYISPPTVKGKPQIRKDLKLE